jgi:prepilin-type N-terminal cleavage/methylation domain-containing protein
VRDERAFTLLEVLVATLVLGLAVVALIQLSAQGLRLLRQADEQQQAALLADRLVRVAGPLVEGVETGQEGPLAWERRIARREAPDELAPTSGAVPDLLALTVMVRWGQQRSLQLASLRLVPRAPGVAR